MKSFWVAGSKFMKEQFCYFMWHGMHLEPPKQLNLKHEATVFLTSSFKAYRKLPQKQLQHYKCAFLSPAVFWHLNHVTFIVNLNKLIFVEEIWLTVWSYFLHALVFQVNCNFLNFKWKLLVPMALSPVKYWVWLHRK